MKRQDIFFNDNQKNLRVAREQVRFKADLLLVGEDNAPRPAQLTTDCIKFLKPYLCVLGLLISVSANGQVVQDLETGKKLAMAMNKLVIIDFWAHWCGPCRVMDAQLWQNDAFVKLLDQYVLVKINVDQQPSLAARFRARSLPMVVIIAPNEDLIWSEIGFGGAAPYLEKLASIPAPNEAFSAAISRYLGLPNDPVRLLKLGEAYQHIGAQTTDQIVQLGFFRLSNAYLQKAKKETHAPTILRKLEVLEAINYVYLGRYKKALKELEKLDQKDPSRNMKEWIAFAKAFCYKCQGQTEKVAIFKEKITDKALRARLEE